MRYLILSDIHANWEALEAVLDHASGRYDEVLCCGDVVGYAADPNRAVEWARENVRFIVRGNHDKAAADLVSLEWFNSSAQAATLWTQRELTAENLDYLRRLPAGPLPIGDLQIFHGSPLDEDGYLVSAEDASQLFGYLDAAVSFFGHTHLQGGFLLYRDGTRRINAVQPGEDGREMTLSEDVLSLINPGSIGQPRDRDPRAAYVLYAPEDRFLTYHRVPYDLEKAQRKIIEAGLPEALANRLGTGS